jgi:hypothetical protein
VLIKFFPHGTGGGSGPVDYLLKEEGREESPPDVLWGDPEQTRDLIDSIDRKHRYTSGVISFAPEDSPDEAEQEQASHAGDSHPHVLPEPYVSLSTHTAPSAQPFG